MVRVGAMGCSIGHGNFEEVYEAGHVGHVELSTGGRWTLHHGSPPPVDSFSTDLEIQIRSLDLPHVDSVPFCLDPKSKKKGLVPVESAVRIWGVP